MAMLRAFILFRCSSWTTSAIRLMAQSKRAASVGGRSLTSSSQASSDWHWITCSGERESNTPRGSSRNQAYTSHMLILDVTDKRHEFQCITTMRPNQHLSLELRLGGMEAILHLRTHSSRGLELQEFERLGKSIIATKMERLSI